MATISVSIVNVTSYTGLELLRLLSQHPYFSVTSVTARSALGRRLGEVFPQFGVAGNISGDLNAKGISDLVITDEPQQTDLAFVCLPHAAAAESVLILLERGTKVVDLSADFRLRDVALYEEWYQHTHPVPALLATAVYGLCERYRERIQGATLVANPGCYATSVILALAPLLAANVVDREKGIISDSKSGVSGAGKEATARTHFVSVADNLSAYSVFAHRHVGEMLEQLKLDARDLIFTPHLLPIPRGILSTIYVHLKRETTAAEVASCFHDFYAGKPWVRVFATPKLPQIQFSLHTNYCDLGFCLAEDGRRLVLVSCVDNLLKGAAGQAVQNMNLMYGFKEQEGLQ